MPKPLDEAQSRYERILRAGQETPKIDFKLELSPEGDGLAEVVKDFCALANSHDAAEPEQRQGLLFIGVGNDGTVSGLPDGFDQDGLTLRLTQRLERRIAPPMRFSVSPPILDAPSGRTYAVVAIEPPAHLPHLVIQETGRVLPGQWFVRRNSSTMLAGPEEFAELHRRLLAQDAQPLRAGLDRLAAEVAVLRDELARAQTRLGAGHPAPALEVNDIPLAEAIRQEYAPREAQLISRIRQLGQELTAQIIQIDDEHLQNEERLKPEQLESALDALTRATQPLAEAVFEISAFVEDPQVWEAVARVLEEIVNTTVVDRFRIDGSKAPLVWYPFILCAYAAAVAAAVHRRYVQLVPMLSGTYDREQFPLMRALRVLPRAETLYRKVTSSRRCAPLAERALTTMVGPAGWFTHRTRREADTTGYFAEIVLSLVWMTTNSQVEKRQEQLPLPGAYLYQARYTARLHSWLRNDKEELQAAWPDLVTLFTLFDLNANEYRDGGCFIEFRPELADTLTA